MAGWIPMSYHRFTTLSRAKLGAIRLQKAQFLSFFLGNNVDAPILEELILRGSRQSTESYILTS